MKIINIAIFSVFFVLFVCCSNNDSDNRYFNGEIRYFDKNNVTTKNVESKSVSLDGIHTGMLATYDSLLFCWDPGYPNHFFSVFNLNTGKEIGLFCEKGRGPGESISLNCIFQLFKKGDDLMTLLHAYNEKKLFIWNISQSVEKGKTVYDTIIPYDNGRMFFKFYQSEDVMFASIPSDDSYANKTTTPFYEKRTIYSNELIDDYPLYKIKSIKNDNNPAIPLEMFFYTWDAMKPDGSKIVQVMRYLPQINILDTHSGNLVGYRMKNSPDFSLVETNMESMNFYYNCVHADDNYIYATYWGKKDWSGNLIPLFNTIHVFDWNGKLLYELIADKSFYRIWLDSVRNRLYTIDVNNDDIYYLDLDELDLK